MRQVYHRHKAGLGAGTKPVLEQARNRFWSGWFSIGAKPVLVRQVYNRYKAGLGAGTKPVLER